MKKFLVTVWVFVCSFYICFSQDIITTKSGSAISAKVLEVSIAEVKYKKFDNQDGPIFVISKLEVESIKYENGTEDTFGSTAINDAASILSGKDLFVKGRSDASRYYRKYRPAGTGTLVASLVSPLVGLVPAIVCSTTEPREENLNYPNAELMKKQEYYDGYTKKAKKIKQGKVWKNWGIAFGVNLLAAIVLVSSGEY